MRKQIPTVIVAAFVLAAFPYFFLSGELHQYLSVAVKTEGNDNIVTAASAVNANAVSYKPIWDEEINKREEAKRCKRYGMNYDGRLHRRRVFLGGLIADDTWHPLQAVAAEGYGIYHSVSYIESNMTQMKIPRKLRFTQGSTQLEKLKMLFGPNTRVTVDSVYIDKDIDGLEREDLQREYISYRWKINGMRPEDIGIVADTDETFTRDFLRAAQICDIPEFRPNQDCRINKIMAQTMVFESSPDCITKHRLWYHPDMSLGECVIHVGDDQVHKPATRIFDSYRMVFDNKELEHRKSQNESFPLLKPPDMRMMSHGVVAYSLLEPNMDEASRNTGQPTRYNAFHFHNFFNNATSIRHKMATYGHPHPRAWKLPLGALHEDLQAAINCVFNRTDKAGHKEVAESIPLNKIVGPVPIYFQNKKYRKERKKQFRQIVLEDEKKYGRGSKA